MVLNYFNNSVIEFKEYTLKNDDKEYLNRLAEFEILNKLKEDELRDIIKEKFDLNFSSDVANLNRNKKDEIMLYLKTVEGTNINQISRVTKVTRYYIKKLYALI